MFTLSNPSEPHITIFIGTTLEDVAATLAAQPDPAALEVRVHRDGASRPLNAGEAATLEAVTSRPPPRGRRF